MVFLFGQGCFNVPMCSTEGWKRSPFVFRGSQAVSPLFPPRFLMASLSKLLSQVADPPGRREGVGGSVSKISLPSGEACALHRWPPAAPIWSSWSAPRRVTARPSSGTSPGRPSWTPLWAMTSLGPKVCGPFDVCCSK